MHIINKALKANLEQQQNNNTHAKFKNGYAKENLIHNEDTETSNANIPIPSSFHFESANERNSMEYLSNLTIESFAEVEV